jgi:hypothetical protein
MNAGGFFTLTNDDVTSDGRQVGMAAISWSKKVFCSYDLGEVKIRKR